MNKECENLALYFYGEMEPQQAAAFKQHLLHCKDCQREMAFLQQMQAALVLPAAPQQLAEQVLAQARPARRWTWLFAPALALVLLLGVGGLFWRMGPSASAFSDDGVSFMASISAEADEEYNSFVSDFEAFEEEF